MFNVDKSPMDSALGGGTKILWVMEKRFMELRTPDDPPRACRLVDNRLCVCGHVCGGHRCIVRGLW